jgi:hypothetical protein
MGINDIFEPTKADFSQLAVDKTLYVKNVEQMININIRTQTTQQLKSNLKSMSASTFQSVSIEWTRARAPRNRCSMLN